MSRVATGVGRNNVSVVQVLSLDGNAERSEAQCFGPQKMGCISGGMVPELSYLNNAGTTWPKPSGVVESAANAYTEPPAWSATRFERVQRDLCALLRLDTPDRLLITPGCTAALALALDNFPWEPGDVVLTSAMEHHALLGPVQRLVQTRGVRHRIVPRAVDGPVDLDAARRLLREGSVRLVAISHGSNVSGEILPVAELSALAREQGAMVLLDAAQTFGVVPVDVPALGADMVVFAGHKGPLAPHGIGGLWAAAHVKFDQSTVVCAIGRGGMPEQACSPMPGYCDGGSVSLGALAGLQSALGYHRGRGPKDWARARAFAEEARAELKGRPGCQVMGGSGPYTAALSFVSEQVPLLSAQAHFANRQVHLAVGQHCAATALDALNASQGTIRASFGPFSDERDLVRLLDAVPSA